MLVRLGPAPMVETQLCTGPRDRQLESDNGIPPALPLSRDTPEQLPDNPYAVRPKTDWGVPVRWDDNTMLFVPSMDDHAILAAMSYIFRNKMEASAFEDLEDISRTNS